MGKQSWDAIPRYQVYNEQLRPLEGINRKYEYGAYISGDSYYSFHPNQGFYYTDLSTGQEIKIADPAYTDSYGLCIDGELMIEVSMYALNQNREPREVHMRYFDGEIWHELEIPEHWQASNFFRLQAATSEHIFFTVSDGVGQGLGDIICFEHGEESPGQSELYYIVIGEGTLHLCDKQPSYENYY